jgi:hypothetical protein
VTWQSVHSTVPLIVMPTQRELCASAKARRCRRLLLATAALSSIGLQETNISSLACLVMWLTRRRELERVRRLRRTMLSRSFSLCEMSANDAVSQMRFYKRDISYLASRMPWLEVTALSQSRTARRRYIASKEEALFILLSRLAMPTRVEDLEQRLFRSKAAISEIFYETLECFLRWASPLVSSSTRGGQTAAPGCKEDVDTGGETNDGTGRQGRRHRAATQTMPSAGDTNDDAGKRDKRWRGVARKSTSPGGEADDKTRLRRKRRRRQERQTMAPGGQADKDTERRRKQRRRAARQTTSPGGEADERS